jgi:hypothetical protein
MKKQISQLTLSSIIILYRYIKKMTGGSDDSNLENLLNEYE